MGNLNTAQNVSSERAGTADNNLSRPAVTQPTENSKIHMGLVEAGLFSARPSVAANSGAPVNATLLRAFEAASIAEAEWMRLPSPRARCRLTGLSRTGLNELRDEGLIKAITVRKSGAQRGVVLINRASLLGYLAQLDSEQNGGGGQ